MTVTKKVTRQINADLVKRLFDTGLGEREMDWVRVDDVHRDNGRWESWHWLVLEDPDGLFWAVEYGMGLTENQDNTFPWKGDGWNVSTLPETVNAFRVFPTVKTVIEFQVWDDDEAP